MVPTTAADGFVRLLTPMTEDDPPIRERMHLDYNHGWMAPDVSGDVGLLEAVRLIADASIADQLAAMPGGC